jgi:lipopolysaccharide export LptBFGC system permease protein LptF
MDIVAHENSGSGKPVRTIIAERGEIVSLKDNSEIQIRLFDGSISDSDGKNIQSIQFETYEFPSIGKQDVRNLQKKIRDYTLAELMIRSTDPSLNLEDRTEIAGSFHHRIAFSFGAFIFVFLGIPLATSVQRGELVVSFGIAMACTSLYYILFAGAKMLAHSTFVLPIIAYWLPNILLLALGGYFLRRALAH